MGSLQSRGLRGESCAPEADTGGVRRDFPHRQARRTCTGNRWGAARAVDSEQTQRASNRRNFWTARPTLGV
eukprot:1155430-Pelagomonas_calceolata.AAC.9